MMLLFNLLTKTVSHFFKCIIFHNTDLYKYVYIIYKSYLLDSKNDEWILSRSLYVLIVIV